MTYLVAMPVDDTSQRLENPAGLPEPTYQPQTHTTQERRGKFHASSNSWRVHVGGVDYWATPGDIAGTTSDYFVLAAVVWELCLGIVHAQEKIEPGRGNKRSRLESEWIRA